MKALRRFGIFWGIVAFSTAVAQPQQNSNSLDVESDPRLAKTVSLRIASLPLHDVVSLLTQKTGVRLRVEPAIREYRACLYVPNRPLHEVMHHLAEAFGYQWERKEIPNHSPEYRLKDPNPPANPMKQIEQSVREFREQWVPLICEQLQKPINQRLETLTQLAENDGANMPQDEEEQRALQAMFESVSTRSIPHVFCVMTDKDWERLMRGETLLFSTKRPILLPPTALSDWITVATEMIRYRYEQYYSPENPESQWAKEWKIAQNEFPKAEEMRVLLRYNAEKRCIETGYAILVNGKDVTPSSFGRGRFFPLFRATDYTPQLGERSPLPLPQHPAFKKQLVEYRELLPSEDWFSWLGNLLLQMAEVSGIPLVAELYPFQGDPWYDWESEAPRPPISWTAVQNLLWARGYRLMFPETEWVVVQSRLRQNARCEDIPQSRLARWFYKPNKRGQLTLEDCAEIALLTETQNEKLYAYLQGYSQLVGLLGPSDFPDTDPDLIHLHGGLEWVRETLIHFADDMSFYYYNRAWNGYKPAGLRPTLRLIGTLSPAQRQLLLRGGELRVASLSPKQQELFLLAWTVADGGLLTVDALWEPTVLSALLADATLRLVPLEQTRGGHTYPRELKSQWKSWADFWRWYRDTSAESRKKLEVSLKHTIRLWQFRLSWRGEERIIHLAINFPLRTKPSSR